MINTPYSGPTLECNKVVGTWNKSTTLENHNCAARDSLEHITDFCVAELLTDSTRDLHKMGMRNPEH